MKTTGIWLDGDDLVERRSVDVSPLLEENKTLRSMGAVGSSEFRLAARFEPILVENYCKQVGITFHEWMANPEHVKRMLRDPELSGFRIWQGRV